jgi:hypothetical protein
MSIDESTGNVSCTFVTCCVSWEEMREAVVQFRDKLNEQIERKERCPFAPSQQVPTASESER